MYACSGTLNTRDSLCQDGPGRGKGAQQGVSLSVAEWVFLLADLLDGGPRILLVSLPALASVFSTYCAPPPGFRLDTTNSHPDTPATHLPRPTPFPPGLVLQSLAPVIVEGAHLRLPLPGRDAATLVRRLLLVSETERSTTRTDEALGHGLERRTRQAPDPDLDLDHGDNGDDNTNTSMGLLL